MPDTRDAGYQGGLAQDPVLQALYLTDDRLGIDAQCHHHDGGEQYHQLARGDGPVSLGITHLHAGLAHIESDHDPSSRAPRALPSTLAPEKPPQPGFDRHANKIELADKAQCHGNT